MARKASGQIIETITADGVTFGARVPAGGKRRYLRLGSTGEGWTREQAERELQYIVAQIERGDWTPPASKAAPVVQESPTFHVFASEWFDARKREWAQGTREDYLWQLKNHLLPFFARYELRDIDVAAVDRYRERKVAEGNLSPTSINKTITRLGQILDVALERGQIAQNPVRVVPRNRRVKVGKRHRSRYLDRPEQIAALLDAAGQLDREATEARSHIGRRALIAVLVFGGLRISEALALRWQDVDLAGGRLLVIGTKTDAADRDVPMLPALRDELLSHKAGAAGARPDALVFSTPTGGPLDRNNTRRRVLRASVERANLALVKAKHVPIPLADGKGQSLTQHGLRHTYITLRLALGDDLARVARDAGHADVSVTYRVYLHVMDLDDAARLALRAIVEGEPLPDGYGQVRASDAAEAVESAETADPRNDETPVIDRRFRERARQDLNLRPPAPEAE